MVPLGERLRRPVGAMVAIVVAAGMAVVAPTATAAPQPDLTVVRTAAPAKASTGRTFTVQTKVRNAGLRKSAATSVEYYLSKNAAKDRGDKRLAGSARLKALIGGVTDDVSARVKVPSRTTPGLYYVIACVARDAGPSRNDCKAAPRRTRVTGLSGDGSIAGELTLTDVGQSQSGSGSAAWERTSTVGIRLDVSGPLLRETFADDGSRYTYTGEDESVGSGGCPTVHRAESGQGGFEYTGDPFTDDIYGHFGHVDRSELRIGLFIHYDATTTWTYCQGGDDVTHSKALNVVSIELEEVSRTARSITYRPVAWQGELSTTSNWDDIGGTVTFTLD